MTITGHCIWVVGASSGIGRSLALKLAELGNTVIISARNKEALASIEEHYPDTIKAMPFDVSINNQEHLAKMRSELRQLTDYLDTVIYCAGICEYEDNLRFEPDMYERVLQTNFLGLVRSINCAMPLLKHSDRRAHIVAVGSLSSVVAFPRAEAYGASKAAVDYFCKALRADFSRLPIDVTLVRPGFVSTELVSNNDFDMPFLQTVEQACERIIKGIERREAVVDFPKRLAWPLRFLGWAPVFWQRWCAPKITRLTQTTPT